MAETSPPVAGSTPTNVITADVSGETETSSSTPSLYADFASDFGVKVEIQQPQSPKATPNPRRSASKISQSETSPQFPESKRARSMAGGAAAIKVPDMSPSKASPPSLKGYDNRSDAGTVAKSMGMRKPPQKLPEDVKRIFSKPTVLQNIPHESFHFMHTPLEIRANALDLRTQSMMDALVKKYKLHDVEAIGPTSQDKQIHVGRICCEAAEGKLNAKSVMLEGSLALSNGRRIKLDISRITDYALFPGQIVAVEGNNAGDGAFIVRKLYEGAPANLPSHTNAELLEFKNANEDQPTVVWAACG